MPTLTQDGEVYILNIGDGENRLHPDWLATFNDALDQVEQAEGPRAIVTAADGKIFSNGLDLEWLQANPDKAAGYVPKANALFARLLGFPVTTVAAVQGHAFGGGAMLALSHDFRVMRADRGFWCLPEVNINMTFPPGMNSLITSRLTPQVAHEAMTTGRRYGGVDALAAQIVDHAVSEDEVLGTAVNLARQHVGLAAPNLGEIKSRLYEKAIADLTS